MAGDEAIVHISSESDIVRVRKSVRDGAAQIGFGLTDVTRIVTAASELARNIFRYAGSGIMKWEVQNDNDRVAMFIIFEDKGPGIANIEEALTPGFTTSGGLGMGLSGTKRLMDEMEIFSEVGSGTTIKTKKWLKKNDKRKNK
jgi:serine/threonine-protein kinase RsbT